MISRVIGTQFYVGVANVKKKKRKTVHFFTLYHFCLQMRRVSLLNRATRRMFPATIFTQRHPESFCLRFSRLLPSLSRATKCDRSPSRGQTWFCSAFMTFFFFANFPANGNVGARERAHPHASLRRGESSCLRPL